MKNRLIFSIIFLVFSLVINAQSTVYNNSMISLESFQAVDYMPRFPGCEDIPSLYEKEKCAKNKLFDYINTNLEYPPESNNSKTIEKVTVMFIVEKNSKISNIKVVGDVDNRFAKSAIKVVKSMNYMPEKWIAGKQNNENVNIWYTIPVRFKSKYN